MNSLGRSSKWPSYDSIPSNSSFLLSESEQTEDEADVFSEGEADGELQKNILPGGGVRILTDGGVRRSGHRLDFPPRSERDQSEHCPNKTTRPDSAFTHGASALTSASSSSSSSATPGDVAFAQKCADLHRFVHPLLELLRGLKSGRFDRGLTSFQQSVAIDRLQRILGILQKPEMGEKYLQNLLQIEMLLKMWFPQLTLSKSSDTTNQSSTNTLTPHWSQNQLHIPVKKRKLSWSDSEHIHHPHRKHGCGHVETSLHPGSSEPPGPKRQKPPEEEAGKAAGQTRGRKQLDTAPSPASCSPATQDSRVSSSNATDSP